METNNATSFVEEKTSKPLLDELLKRKAFQQVVNSLTGWQRHQWAKAGYPGADSSDQTRLVYFVEMKHP